MAFPIVLPSVFDAHQTGRLREIVDQLMPSDLKDEDINSFDMQKALRRYGPEGRALMEETFALFCRSRCLNVARTILKDEIAFLYPHCAFRYHQPGEQHSHLPFHIDGDFMGQAVTSLNFWVPLNDVGLEAPGLTFLKPDVDPNVFLRVWLTDAMKRTFKRYSREDVAAIYGRPIEEFTYSPEMKAGSVAIFHHLTPHATQSLPGGGAFRVSMEFRVARRNDMPERYRVQGQGIAIPREVEGDWVMRYANALTPNEELPDPIPA